MTAADHRIAALEGQVAELAAEVSDLREQALMIRTIEELALLRFGYTPPSGYQGILKAPRPSHLRPVDGGRR